jgi:hypothetical protein
LSQFQKHIRLKIYNALTLPALFYGCETWANREQDKYRMSAEMKLTRRKSKYTRQDYKANEDILKLTQL